MWTARSAPRTCGAPASASEKTATDSIPRRASVRSIRTAISPRLAIRTRSNMASGAARLVIDRAGRERVRAERPAEHLLRLARGEQQLLQVDAGLDAHLVKHRDEVLGGDVAGRAGRERTAAELAEARLEGLAAGVERGEHVGQSLTAGVVEVRGQFDPRQLGAGALEEFAHLH